MSQKKTYLLFLAIAFLTFIVATECTKQVNSFKQLAEQHCSQFPMELIWRISSGTLSEKYGEQFYDLDCYIRTFVRKDGLTLQSKIKYEDQQQQQQQQEEEQEQDQLQAALQVDLIVQQYAAGLKSCLPQGVQPVEASYIIWRFFRYLIQNDYLYEWMRARIRATLGYQAQRPNAWMDGQISADRLRLDKLFSNQFYDYLDTLMFKDYLYPLLTFFRQNIVVALTGKVTQSGNPMLFQSIQTHNYLKKIFYPVLLNLNQQKGQKIFAYTLPGFPLLIAGSTTRFAWAFTGVLVDRTNIQQIQTVGFKYYNHDSQQWMKLNNQQIEIPGVKDKVCKFMYSSYGPLYYKQQREGKNQEYIVKWHQKQKKIRTLFSDMLKLIRSRGDSIIEQSQSLQFPFNSIVYINDIGVHTYICQQFYPSYFLYPDMFGQPERLSQRLFFYNNKKIIVASNTMLTTTKQQEYIKSQTLNYFDEQLISTFKAAKQNKYTLQQFLSLVQSIKTSENIKKQRQAFTRIYRKIKFLYLKQQDRKRCDKVISLLDKWDNNLADKHLAPIFILWQYFLREYTFNYVSASKFGSAIVKHKILSQYYWTNQLALWQKGTSYGQCETAQYEEMKHQVNGTGHNSSCYLNIIRAINTTTNIIAEKYNNDLSKINLSDFTQKKYFENNEGNFLGSHVQQAFRVYYSKQLIFATEVNNPEIIYYDSYEQNQNLINLAYLQQSKTDKQQDKQQYQDEQL